MPIKLGNADIADVKIGSSQVDKIYLETSLVWTKVIPLSWQPIPSQIAAVHESWGFNSILYLNNPGNVAVTITSLSTWTDTDLRFSNGVFTKRNGAGVSGTPLTLQIRATGGGSSADTSFVFRSVSVRWRTIPDITVARQGLVRINLHDYGVDNPVQTQNYTVSGLPLGVSYVESTKRIQGRPSQTGRSTVTVAYRNFPSISTTFTITVT